MSRSPTIFFSSTVLSYRVSVFAGGYFTTNNCILQKLPIYSYQIPTICKFCTYKFTYWLTCLFGPKISVHGVLVGLFTDILGSFPGISWPFIEWQNLSHPPHAFATGTLPSCFSSQIVNKYTFLILFSATFLLFFAFSAS